MVKPELFFYKKPFMGKDFKAAHHQMDYCKPPLIPE